jgi:sugar phosphate isomerase/epimerase
MRCSLTRRRFVQAALAGIACSGPVLAAARPKMRFGLVTYMWGADWDLPTLLKNCTLAGVGGVELRTTHRHGVEPSLSAEQRRQVRQQFQDSPVAVVGIGSDERFDSPDPARLAAAIEATRAFVVLSKDIGASGVKVKPDRFHDGVPRQRTIEQIGRALNEVGAFAADHGQQIRLEVHGQCAELPTIAAIMKVADHPAVAVCWNSNPQDLAGAGLEQNFELVRHRLGQTVHIHSYNHPTFKYPYEELVRLLAAARYDGWLLLEDGGPIPPDRVAAMIDQRRHFEPLIAEHERRASGQSHRSVKSRHA